MSGQVFARLDGVWQPLDRGLRGTRQLDLEDVGGTALDNLYAVSAFGSMVHFDGNKWSDIALPTNRPLSGVKVVAADEVYACGDDGTVIRGSSSTGVWQLISLDSFDESFSAVERHGTALFVAHPDGLKTWDGSVWSDVDLGLEGEVDCQTLHSKDGYLFSFGYQTLLVHDGSTWARMVPPTTV